MGVPIPHYVEIVFSERGPRFLNDIRGVPARILKMTVEPALANKGATVLLKKGEEIMRLCHEPEILKRVGDTKDYAVGGTPGEKCVITFY